MWFFRKKRVKVTAYWREPGGVTRSISKEVVSAHKRKVIIMYPAGIKTRVEVES